MAISEAREQIANSVERTLREQARQNEVRIAWLRVGALFFTAAAYWLACLLPQIATGAAAKPSLALSASLWLIYAIALLVALRRGLYSPRLAPIIALLDAAALLTNHIFVSSSYGPPIHPLLSVRALALGCMLFAVSGGLRLARTAAAWTTGLGIAVFLVGALLSGEPRAASLFSAGLILSGGALGVWMTGQVRRATASEISRTTLERFLPRRVIEGAWGDPLAILGEARAVEATVLVSDLRGFTRFAETRSPADVLVFLSTVQGEFARVIEAHAARSTSSWAMGCSRCSEPQTR